MITIRKTFAGGLAALSLGACIAAATTTPAEAQWRGHRGGYYHNGGYYGGGWRGPAAAGLIGGLALGTLAASRYGAYPEYGYGEGYATGYYGGGYDAPYAYDGYEVAPVVRYSYRSHNYNPYSQTRQPRDPRNSASSGGNGYTFN